MVVAVMLVETIRSQDVTLSRFLTAAGYWNQLMTRTKPLPPLPPGPELFPSRLAPPPAAPAPLFA
jgi:hypothetical protein